MMDRNAYLEKMEAQLKQWRAEVDKLTAKAQEAKADAKIDLERQATELKTKYEDARKRFDELKQAGEDTFAKMREQFEARVREFSSAFDRATTAARQEVAGTSHR